MEVDANVVLPAPRTTHAPRPTEFHRLTAAAAEQRVLRVKQRISVLQQELGMAYTGHTQQYQELWMPVWKAYYDHMVVGDEKDKVKHRQ